MMESGEYDWEDVEEELESEDEEAPELVPIEEDRGRDRKLSDKKRSKSVPIPRKEFQSDQSSESELDEEEDLEELSSDALDAAIEELEGSAEPDNEHGFVYAHNLNTYRLNKKERIEEMEKEKEENKSGRKDYQKKRDKKRLRKLGKTNIEKLKSKPMAMVLPKKVREIKFMRDREARKVKIKKGGMQLGHWKKHTKQKLEAKKRRKVNH